MGKTSEEMEKPVQERIGRRATNGPWTYEELLDAILSGTEEDDIQALKDAGILDENGDVTPLYSQDWGDKVTRTFDYGLDEKNYYFD